MRAVFRYIVRVDDEWHVHTLTSEPLHVAARTPGMVEFWAESDPDDEPRDYRFIVVGTGHLIPEGAEYVGTAVAEYGLVWHLYRKRGAV